MNPQEPSSSFDPNDAIDNIRRRPAMYLGSVEFFGFIQYVVSAFDLMLDHDASWIEFEPLGNEEFRLSSDAIIPLAVNENDQLVPFEGFSDRSSKYPSHLPDGVIVLALSNSFRVTVNDGTQCTVLESERGTRQSLECFDSASREGGTVIECEPDSGIFSVTEVSPSVVHSYCKRIACLHPGVTFRIKVGSDLTEYHSKRGIRDFFDAITTPYQILHEPIQLSVSDDDLTVEAVFVFHSWTENQIWSFANKGRVPDGGTHEAGFLDAISSVQNLKSSSAVGTLAVLQIEYPGVTYEGCIKSRIGNPELRERVSHLISSELVKWLPEHPEEARHIERVERFQFGSIW